MEKISLKQQEKLARQLLELNYVIKKRKQINPLEFFEHLPLQERFHNDTAKTKGIFGGNRSGKTEECAEYVIRKCLERPKQRWWAVAASFSDSVNIQQRKVWELLPKLHIKYGKYDEVNGFTNRKLIFDNGSIVIFKSYDQKTEAFASDDIDGIWNDEEPPYDIYKEQRMRLMDRDGEMLISMTSTKGITDFIQDVFEDHDVAESQYAPFADKELPRVVEKDGMRFYLLWSTENPYINQERVKHEVKLMTLHEIIARMYGLPINLAGKIYMRFAKDIHILPFEEVDLSDCTIYQILDPHDRKPWAMAWKAINKAGTAYTFDEYPNKNFNDMLYDDKTYDEYAEIIRIKEEAIFDMFGKKVYKRIIDPNYGNSTIKLAKRQGGQSSTTIKKELKKRKLIYHDGIDALEDGHLKVREKLYYEEKGDEIVVQPKTFFTDNCQNSIRHHSRYSRKDIMTVDDDVKDSVKPKEKYKDFCDLERYFWMSRPICVEGRKPIAIPEFQKVY